MRKLFLLVGVLVLAGCSTAPKLGSDWHHIMDTGRADQNTVARHYVQNSSIRLLGDGVREAKALDVYESPKLYDNSGKRYKAILKNKQVDCKRNGALYPQRNVSATAYSAVPPADENLVGKFSVEGKWISPREYSLGDMQSKYICGQ